MKKLILASGSPRRKEILTSLGFNFSVRKVDYDEQFSDSLPAHQVAEFIAIEKNKVVPRELDNEIIEVGI